MLTNVWNKYLPVIKILLKKSKQGEQQLAINQSDFQKAGIARKSGNKFSLLLKKGKVDNIVIPSPIAAELAAGLLQDEAIKAILMQHDYSITMDTRYQLRIAQLDEADLEESNHQQLSHA